MEDRGQGSKPDLRNSAVRDYRGASGNVAIVDLCTHLAYRKGEAGQHPPVRRRARALSQQNTTRRNFKDLKGMLGNAKALKRNNWECKGIFIGPSMAPRFSRPPKFRPRVFSLTVQVARSASGSNFAARMVSRRNIANMLDPKLVVRLEASFGRALVDFVRIS
jgi:hypothetical protein